MTMINLRSLCPVVALLVLVLFWDAAADDGLNKAIKEKIAALYQLDRAATEIEIRKNNIRISESEYDSLEITPMTSSAPRGLIPFQVKLYSRNELVKKKQIRAKIAWFDYVLVTADRIRRQEIITSDKYRVEKRETTYLTEKPVTSADELKGRWAKRNIGKRQILTTGMVELIPTITSGREVSILYKTDVLEISARGIALETGYSGDIIRVKNSQSRKVIACTIVDEDTVQVSSH